MTALDLVAPSDTIGYSRPRLPRAMRRLLVGWRRKRRQARMYLDLQQLDERMLYDIGIDPLNLRGSLEDKASASVLLEAMRKQFDYRER